MDSAELDDGVDRVFAFQHVAPSDTVSYGQDWPNVRSELSRDIVDAVFVGHSHDENGKKTHDGQDYFHCEMIGDDRRDVPYGLRVLDIYDN